MVIKTFGEIADEYTILLLKKNRIFDANPEKYSAGDVEPILYRIDELRQELDDLIAPLQEKNQILANFFIDKLSEANAEIWNLEASIRTLSLREWFKGDDCYLEIGKRAESIRHINSYRVKYKNKLNEMHNQFMEIKKDHLSEGKSDTQKT